MLPKKVLPAYTSIATFENGDSPLSKTPLRLLSFQTEPAYVRPVWPAGPGDPQMQAHLDIEVEDQFVAVSFAAAHLIGAVDGAGKLHVRLKQGWRHLYVAGAKQERVPVY